MATILSSRVARPLLPVLAGAAAGLLTAVLASGARAPAPPADARSVETRPVAAASLPDRVAGSRIAALERAVSEIEDQRHAATGDAASAAPGPSPEDEHRAVTEALDRAIARHDGEPRTAAWADRATALLGSDFSQITKTRHFAIDQVDCRSQSCVATLTWSDYRAASESVGDLLHRNYGLNCGRMVLMPEPKDPGASYTTRVVFECASPDAALGSG